MECARLVKLMLGGPCDRFVRVRSLPLVALQLVRVRGTTVVVAVVVVVIVVVRALIVALRHSIL